MDSINLPQEREKEKLLWKTQKTSRTIKCCNFFLDENLVECQEELQDS